MERLVDALRALPHVDARQTAAHLATTGPDRGIDAEVEFSAGDKNYRLIVQVKKSVFPRDAQQLLWQISRYRNVAGQGSSERHIVPLLVAESISPGAKDLLKEENCGFYELGGSLFLPARGAYIYIEKPPSKTVQKTVGSLFKGKRSQVLHALLIRHLDWFSVKDLAKLARVSPATASETLVELERFEWVGVKGQGPSKERRLDEPAALLNEWQKQVLAAPRRPADRRFYVPSSDNDAIARHLAEISEMLVIDYAITEQSAAQFYAPFLTTVSRLTCRLASGHGLDELYAELDARPVNEGANLIVIETSSRGEFLFREQVDGLWLASPIQVYLDLLRSGGRGKEMAEHLRQERIGF